VLSTFAWTGKAAQAANNRIPIFPYIVYSPIAHDAGHRLASPAVGVALLYGVGRHAFLAGARPWPLLRL